MARPKASAAWQLNASQPTIANSQAAQPRPHGAAGRPAPPHIQPPTLETPRLWLRSMQATDFDDLLLIFTDLKVMAAFDSPPFDRQQMTQWLQRNLDHQAHYGYGLFSVILKSNGVLIGNCGLEVMTVDDAVAAELGYDFRSDYWNLGLATEAALAVRDYAFEVLGLPQLDQPHSRRESRLTARGRKGRHAAPGGVQPLRVSVLEIRCSTRASGRGVTSNWPSCATQCAKPIDLLSRRQALSNQRNCTVICLPEDTILSQLCSDIASTARVRLIEPAIPETGIYGQIAKQGVDLCRSIVHSWN